MSTPPLPTVSYKPPAITSSEKKERGVPNIHHYRRQKLLGKGNFGKVYVARSPDGIDYAIKEMDMSGAGQKLKERAIWEVKVTSEASGGHPFIIDFVEAMCERQTVYIVMEYAAGGNLKQKLESQIKQGKLWSEWRIRRYMLQILLAVKGLHDNHILHRDMKTENIFLTENDDVKLGDFGLARALNAFGQTSTYAVTSAGTPGYIAPEILMNQRYDHKADIWSVGVILYELASGRLPFHPSNRYSVINQPHQPLPTHLTTEFRQLINSMLRKNPHGRPSVDELLQSDILREAFETQLPIDQRRAFDHSGRFLAFESRNGAIHVEEITRQIIGSVRALDFSDEAMQEVAAAAPAPRSTREMDVPGAAPPGDPEDLSVTPTRPPPIVTKRRKDVIYLTASNTNTAEYASIAQKVAQDVAERRRRGEHVPPGSQMTYTSYATDPPTILTFTVEGEDEDSLTDESDDDASTEVSVPSTAPAIPARTSLAPKVPQKITVSASSVEETEDDESIACSSLISGTKSLNRTQVSTDTIAIANRPIPRPVPPARPTRPEGSKSSRRSEPLSPRSEACTETATEVTATEITHEEGGDECSEISDVDAAHERMLYNDTRSALQRLISVIEAEATAAAAAAAAITVGEPAADQVHPPVGSPHRSPLRSPRESGVKSPAAAQRTPERKSPSPTAENAATAKAAALAAAAAAAAAAATTTGSDSETGSENDNHSTTTQSSIAVPKRTSRGSKSPKSEQAPAVRHGRVVADAPATEETPAQAPSPPALSASKNRSASPKGSATSPIAVASQKSSSPKSAAAESPRGTASPKAAASPREQSPVSHARADSEEVTQVDESSVSAHPDGRPLEHISISSGAPETSAVIELSSEHDSGVHDASAVNPAIKVVDTTPGVGQLDADESAGTSGLGLSSVANVSSIVMNSALLGENTGLSNMSGSRVLASTPELPESLRTKSREIAEEKLWRQAQRRDNTALSALEIRSPKSPKGRRVTSLPTPTQKTPPAVNGLGVSHGSGASSTEYSSSSSSEDEEEASRHVPRAANEKATEKPSTVVYTLPSVDGGLPTTVSYVTDPVTQDATVTYTNPSTDPPTIVTYSISAPKAPTVKEAVVAGVDPNLAATPAGGVSVESAKDTTVNYRNGLLERDARTGNMKVVGNGRVPSTKDATTVTYTNLATGTVVTYTIGPDQSFTHNPFSHTFQQLAATASPGGSSRKSRGRSATAEAVDSPHESSTNRRQRMLSRGTSPSSASPDSPDSPYIPSKRSPSYSAGQGAVRPVVSASSIATSSKTSSAMAMGNFETGSEDDFDESASGVSPRSPRRHVTAATVAALPTRTPVPAAAPPLPAPAPAPAPVTTTTTTTTSSTAGSFGRSFGYLPDGSNSWGSSRPQTFSSGLASNRVGSYAGYYQ